VSVTLYLRNIYIHIYLPSVLQSDYAIKNIYLKNKCVDLVKVTLLNRKSQSCAVRTVYTFGVSAAVLFLPIHTPSLEYQCVNFDISL